MGFIKMLIGLPLLVVIIVFAFVNNDLATFSLWPFNLEITVSLSVAIVFLILFGFLIGELFAWLSYAPLRKALRAQKKQNRRLSKEQEKLTREMETLHENLTKQTAVESPYEENSFRGRLRRMFTRKNNKTEHQVSKAAVNGNPVDKF